MNIHRKELILCNLDDEFSTTFSRAAFADLLRAGAVGAAALALEHLALWQEPLRLPPPASYVVGTATLGAALTWWCQRQGCAQAAVAFWGIAGVGGTVVSVAYWARHVARQLDARAFHAGIVAAPHLTPAPPAPGLRRREDTTHHGNYQRPAPGN
jgi:hypothetical protein